MKVLVLENETCFGVFIVLGQKGNVIGLVAVVFVIAMSERFRFVRVASFLLSFCCVFCLSFAIRDSSDEQNAFYDPPQEYHTRVTITSKSHTRVKRKNIVTLSLGIS